MKILLGITLAEPGGAQSFVLGFAEWLKERGHDVLIVAGDGDWLFDQCRTKNIRHKRVTTLGRSVEPLRDYLAYKNLKKIFLEERPDAVHLNSSKMGVLGSLAASKGQVPRVVYRIGGWAFLEPTTAFGQWLSRTAERWSAKWKDVIVCVHPGDAEVAQRLGIRPRDGVIVAPNGVDVPNFDLHLLSRDQARIALRLDTNAFTFGTMANFFPAKDLPHYLDACAIVHKAAPNVMFYLLGEGGLREDIERRRRELALESCVLMPGSHDHAATLMCAFDAFVLPSKKEGMPWSLLEAMAASLPCIVTDVGAARWMLTDPVTKTEAGWIVPSQNPDALAHAMLECLRDRNEAIRKGELARTIVETRFPLEKTYLENERALIF